MNARPGFSADDAERQAGDSAANYLARAVCTLAEATGLEKTLSNNPCGFVDRFAPLLAALIEAQAREYQSWVIFERLGELAGVWRDLGESTLSGLADIAERLDERNATLCPNCKATKEQRP